MSESQANNAGTNPSDQPVPRIGFLRRFFWLEDKIAKLTEAGVWANQSTWPELEVVRQARKGVEALGDEYATTSAGAILGRIEVHLLIRVLMRREGLSCSSGQLTEQDWTTGEQVLEIREMLARLTLNEAAALKACLGKQAELSLVGLDANELQHVASGLQRAAELLTAPIDRDDEKIHQLKIQRWVRVGAAAVLVLCLFWAVSAVIEVLTRKPNIALNRPTRASSYLASEYLPNHHALDATRVVDGNRTSVGFHTDFGPNPFLIIDLGKPQDFNKVVVYNRMDCCQDRAVPLFLEVSDDDTNYRALAERRETFVSWTADGLHAKGRYVRLRVGGSAYFHLAEVEIY